MILRAIFPIPKHKSFLKSVTSISMTFLKVKQKQVLQKILGLGLGMLNQMPHDNKTRFR